MTSVLRHALLACLMMSWLSTWSAAQGPPFQGGGPGQGRGVQSGAGQPGGGQPGGGQPGGGQPGGGRGQGAGGRSGRTQAMLERLDANRDGVLQASEIPERMRSMVDRYAGRSGAAQQGNLRIADLIASAERNRNAGGPNGAGQNNPAGAAQAANSIGGFGVPVERPTVPGFDPAQAAQAAQAAAAAATPTGSSSRSARGATGGQAGTSQVDRVLQQYDANKNGSLDQSEWAAVKWSGPGPETSDTNRDGRLSREELSARLARRSQNSNTGGPGQGGSGQGGSGQGGSGQGGPGQGGSGQGGSGQGGPGQGGPWGQRGQRGQRGPGGQGGPGGAWGGDQGGQWAQGGDQQRRRGRNGETAEAGTDRPNRRGGGNWGGPGGGPGGGGGPWGQDGGSGGWGGPGGGENADWGGPGGGGGNWGGGGGGNWGGGGGPGGGGENGGDAGTEDRYQRYAQSMLRRYDRNQNGVLEQDEFGQMRGNTADLDKNKDGKVTVEELVARVSGNRRGGAGANNAASSGPKNYRFLTAKERWPSNLPSWYGQRDLDADGQLSMAEWSNSWTDDDVAEFSRYDTNSDGFVTPAESIAGDRRQ